MKYGVHSAAELGIQFEWISRSQHFGTDPVPKTNSKQKVLLMSWQDYFKTATLAREEYLKYIISAEIVKATANRDYHIDIASTAIDENGVDMILISDESTAHLQLKSRWDATTKSWSIRRKYCLPCVNRWPIAGDNFRSLPPRTYHALILADVSTGQNGSTPDIQYSVFDYQVLFLLHQGILKRKKTISQKSVKKFYEEAYKSSASSNCPVTIPIAALLPLELNDILSWCGFIVADQSIEYSIFQLSNIATNWRSVSDNQNEAAKQWASHLDIIGEWFDTLPDTGFVMNKPAYF